MTSFVDKKRLEEITKLAMLEIKENEVEKYLNLMNQSIETLEALDKINVDKAVESNLNLEISKISKNISNLESKLNKGSEFSFLLTDSVDSMAEIANS